MRAGSGPAAAVVEQVIEAGFRMAAAQSMMSWSIAGARAWRQVFGREQRVEELRGRRWRGWDRAGESRPDASHSAAATRYRPPSRGSGAQQGRKKRPACA